MSKYRCSQCKRKYSSREYDALETVETYPEEDGGGTERVCECGSGMRSDLWYISDEIGRADEFRVLTTALKVGHGRDHDQYYETRVQHEHGSRIIDRHKTEDEAIDGHETTVSRIENNEFHYEPISWKLVLDEDGIPDFEEGEEYDFDRLPDSDMEPSGKLSWVDDNTLAGAFDGQLVEFEWSHVRVTDVKYLTDDGEVVDSLRERSPETTEGCEVVGEEP